MRRSIVYHVKERVPFPTFEVIANPTITLSEIRQRRFTILDREEIKYRRLRNNRFRDKVNWMKVIRSKK